ncbi:thiol reductant ABC exporter subunit CydD [Williamsia sp. MIQD14]|uniref:thiol reductant ABC exporter subunit CydD n=1 Tax=Williamsia sp. MIQD14 TaxID=3425703 RepID=UPI003D9FC73F
MSTRRGGPIDPRLLRRSPAARAHIALTSLTGIVTAAAVIVGAVMIATILAELVADPNARSLHAQSGHITVLTAAFGVRVAATVLGDRYAHRASAEVIAQLRDAALRAVTDPARTPPRTLHRMRGELITTLTTGLDALGPYLTSFVPALVLSVTVTPAVIVVMALTDPTSAIVVIVTLPLIPVFMILIGLMTRDRTRARLDATAAQGAQMLDLVAGIGTLRALHRASEPTERVAALGQRSRRSTMAALRIAFLSGGVLELLSTLCVALVAVGVGLRLVFGDMPLQAGILALILAPEVYLPLRSVGAQFHNSEAGRAAADDVLDLVDTPPVRTTAHLARTTAHLARTTAHSAGVELCDVGVVDRDGWAPRHLDLHCAPGTVTVLTGPNGSGKTTALQVIAGLVEPDEGVARAAATAAWLAEPPVMIPGTVAENLALFGTRSRDDIARTAAAVGFDTVLAEIGGLEARIGNGGAGLSAGQRQRLALTRVLASPAPVLLLDEPTAHLDAESEAMVMRAVRARARDGATVVVVSHRPAVLDAADVVVDLGVDVGSRADA